jgi:hypothetical protein
MNFAAFSMNLAAQIIKRAAQKNKLAAQKNNEVAAQNYEFSCPNLRQPLGNYQIRHEKMLLLISLSSHSIQIPGSCGKFPKNLQSLTKIGLPDRCIFLGQCLLDVKTL